MTRSLAEVQASASGPTFFPSFRSHRTIPKYYRTLRTRIYPSRSLPSSQSDVTVDRARQQLQIKILTRVPFRETAAEFRLLRRAPWKQTSPEVRFLKRHQRRRRPRWWKTGSFIRLFKTAHLPARRSQLQPWRTRWPQTVRRSLGCPCLRRRFEVLRVPTRMPRRLDRLWRQRRSEMTSRLRCKFPENFHSWRRCRLMTSMKSKGILSPQMWPPIDLSVSQFVILQFILRVDVHEWVCFILHTIGHSYKGFVIVNYLWPIL